MTDIVVRLREEWTYDTEQIMEEAAEEIERLRDHRDRLCRWQEESDKADARLGAELERAAEEIERLRTRIGELNRALSQADQDCLNAEAEIERLREEAGYAKLMYDKHMAERLSRAEAVVEAARECLLPGPGLHEIADAHGHDAHEYYYHVMKYWEDRYRSMQNTLRDALTAYDADGAKKSVIRFRIKEKP